MSELAAARRGKEARRREDNITLKRVMRVGIKRELESSERNKLKSSQGT